MTEMTTGADLVKSQIDIVRGLDWDRPAEGIFGHAIEVRLNAEIPPRISAGSWTRPGISAAEWAGIAHR